MFKFVKYCRINCTDMMRSVQIYPKHPKLITTKKKRTILQVQIRKVNELAEKSIDQVITNYPVNYNVCHIGEIHDVGKRGNNN